MDVNLRHASGGQVLHSDGAWVQCLARVLGDWSLRSKHCSLSRLPIFSFSERRPVFPFGGSPISHVVRQTSDGGFLFIEEGSKARFLGDLLVTDYTIRSVVVDGDVAEDQLDGGCVFNQVCRGS